MVHPSALTVMLLATCRIQTVSASSCFVSVRSLPKTSLGLRALNSQSDNDIETLPGVSRLGTLQSLLSARGAPGSRGCNAPNGDLLPISPSTALSSNEYIDLHPHLLPLAKSQSTGNLVCALRRAYADDASYDSPSINAPLPIVESAVGLPGMRLLSLNSEHLMRRIAADADANLESDAAQQIIGMYNDGLGVGKLLDKLLDTTYEAGSVAKLGYGCDKYVLLRVGPFPDLYETMSLNHLSRGDTESSLIAAEANNGKFGGFGSTFAFYAKLLSSLPKRAEEARDAARMCVRMPLPSMGLTRNDFADVSKIAEFATSIHTTDEALEKMLYFYEKIREHEKEDNSGDKTAKQIAMDEANYLLDKACLTGQKYGEVRGMIAEIYRAVGMEEMASFVDRS
ncbi:hypothetical protein HJC23_005068 [Cyclotella cryptica]|uniref:Uncharacterized protein n=1 Tax=Cyclotella cryptica TaxID=29204 RepID=A0ABD3QE59_9STRA|eukprot:CCRYP_006307-RA/>CCRYP_006307-RA protein AED:0.00 eAED:0.00 QI:73/-1/1/1/-1/1/1/134/396